jgi:uncharacterized RDD family membrane protein YckC
MKCPKCGYLGFEAVDRCRNCGYDFSLSRPAILPELPLRDDADEGGPLEDLTLLEAPSVSEPPWQGTSGLDGTPPAARVALRHPGGSMGAPLGSGRHAAAPSAELPLFAPPTDDGPLITRASPPRPPLAVRRATPEVARLRPLRTPMLDLEAPAGPADAVARAAGAADRGPLPADGGPPEVAPLAARLAAVAIDLGILALIDVIVVYFTMQICGLTIDDADMLPKGPLVGFLAVQNGAYFVAFTAGGQTLGKMVAGIRVVSADAYGSVDLGRSLLRTLVWALLASPVGLGFVTALFGREHRGLHDRCAGTRVVRATL